ncbi:uncharacterized protein SCHCODRAFT_02494863 [Schizophyllum commune H4-8]|nr:uncharacterized protein SCHCODRAFT_02494863 [Schizophyllum commune H4-8]KAI5894574.1 hypothetical protein SCHCODRAFT_02494863 [Schizophyllum commune H4-8]
MCDAIERLHSGAASVFFAQETRMYHVGIAFAGDLFQLAYYDRAGCVLSGTHNVHENPGVLIRAVIGLSLLDESYVGKDTSITVRDRRAFVTVGGVEYEIVELLAAGGDILGKGTVCWRCCRPSSSENYVIKNTWTVLGQLRKPEGEFLRKAARVEGVPNLVCEEKVLRRNGLPQNTLWLRDTLQGSERLAILKNHLQMELRRLVLQPCGRPLVDFQDKDELLTGFNDSIMTHYQLYELCILHCDISDNNIMLRTREHPSSSRGLLIDLDSADEVDSLTGLANVNFGMGTVPFVASDILRPHGSNGRAPWHDLESFLHVLMYICATCSGPSDTPRTNFDLESSPMGPWLTGDYVRKKEIMFDYDESAFRSFVDSVFDPYFDDLKDLVCDLRAVTRTRSGHFTVMDVFDKHMRLRANARAKAAAVQQKDGTPPAGPSARKKRRHSSRPDPPSSNAQEGEGVTDARATSSSATSSSSSSSSSSNASDDSSHASDDTDHTLVSSRSGSEKLTADDTKDGLEDSLEDGSKRAKAFTPRRSQRVKRQRVR